MGRVQIGWLYKAERLFSMNHLLEADKLDAALACFEGKAWAWFQGVSRHRPAQTWGELKDFMVGEIIGP